MAHHHKRLTQTRGRSSVGRAPPLQGGGQEFEPPRLHQIPTQGACHYRPATVYFRLRGENYVCERRFTQSNNTHSILMYFQSIGLRHQADGLCKS